MRIVDVFSGAGGVTTGAQSIGVDVVAAINHWPLALASHAANHPSVRHVCDDALAYDFRDLDAHDVGHLSPECTWYTGARGESPRIMGHVFDPRDRRDVSRATANCTVRYARACEPRAVTVENVTEYGASPEAARVVRAMARMGYRHRRFTVDAAHLGVAQSRVRLFEVFMKGRAVPRWSVPVPATLTPASSVIDLRAPCNPIDAPSRRAMGQRALSERTLRQISEGAARFDGDPFLVPYYGAWRKGSRVVVYPLTRPLGTLTTVDRYALARRDGDTWGVRMLTPDEMARAFGFPPGYALRGTRRERVHQIGNAVCPPVAAWLLSRVREVLG